MSAPHSISQLWRRSKQALSNPMPIGLASTALSMVMLLLGNNLVSVRHLSSRAAFLRRQNFNRAGNQWIDTNFNISLLV